MNSQFLGSEAIAIAIKSGNVNIGGSTNVEVLDLNEESRKSQLQHADLLRRYEAQKRARSIAVPTAIDEVKMRLRELGHPVTIFGENHADRRERLKEVIASLELGEEELSKLQAIINQSSSFQAVSTNIQSIQLATESTLQAGITAAAATGKQTAKEVFYTNASDKLISTRKMIAEYSFKRAHERITRTKRIRENDEGEQQLEDDMISSLYSSLTSDKSSSSSCLGLNASQVGDDRPLSCVRVSSDGMKVASASLSGVVKIWDLDSLAPLGVCRGHEERVTGVAWSPFGTDYAQEFQLLASTSSDATCRLWKYKNNSGEYSTHDDYSSTIRSSTVGSSSAVSSTGEEGQGQTEGAVGVLRGHGGVVSDCAFHSSGRVLGTASSDFTWRLWDVESCQELLLQDGHGRECTTIDFHPDGSLVLTGDVSGLALLWDLRSGQMVQAFQGHVKKVVSSCFSPNGFQAATCSTDNAVRVWDLRKRKCTYVLPAHCNAITDVRYGGQGEVLMTSSFDGTVKLWGARDYRLLTVLTGHQGKVMGCDFAPVPAYCTSTGAGMVRVVSAGFDRTIKTWTAQDTI